MSVVFASWAGFAGCVGSSRNAAAVLGGEWLTIESGEPPPRVLDCELLFLSSWRPEYEAILARRTGPTIARWHSSLLQTELSGEVESLAGLVERVERGELAAIAASDPDVVAVLARPEVRHLPEVIALDADGDVRPVALAGTNVSLFGEPYPRKSLLVQAAAFERARSGADGWRLHLNGQTLRRPAYGRWLELAGVPFVEHGFLPRAGYLSLVAAMDAGLAATLSESYGLVAAEHVLLGVPVVTSPAVVSVAAGPLQAAEPWDAGSVAAALRRALKSEPATATAARRALVRDAERRAAVARRALSELRLARAAAR